MTKQKPYSLKVEAALLARVYRAELVELSNIVGSWFITIAKDLARYACELALYDVRRNYHHHVGRHR